MSSRLVSTLVALSIALASSARADDPPVATRIFKPLATLPVFAPSTVAGGMVLSLGEPTGSAGLAGRLASAPLRLSLQSDLPTLAGLFPNCTSREEAAGNSAPGGFPLQRYTMLALGPHLVLSGFSTGGCPVDAGMGGGLTYATSVAPKLWLVGGAGTYSIPGHDMILTQTRTDVRVDLIKETDSGRTYGVGVGKRGVTFGGSF
jgi:hypothetical protein